MAKPRPPKPGDEIKKNITAIREMREGLMKDFQRVDAKINRMPSGQDKRSMREDQNKLKRQSGLFDESELYRSPRQDWSSEQLMATATHLKDAARKWKAGGQLDRANECLSEAVTIEREAADRRAAERERK
jgi:hypothetical protein